MSVGPSRLEVGLEEVRQWIGELQLERAQKKLHSLAQRKIPREILPVFSALCRRAWVPELSLRLLHPWVRPRREKKTRPGFSPATAAETIEYAASLIWLGSTDEAMGVLARLPADDLYVNLLIGTNHFWRGETDTALDHFKISAGPIPGIDEMEGWATYWIANTLVQDVRRSAESLPHFDRVTGIARAAKDLRLEAYAGSGRVLALLQLARWEEARTTLQETRALLHERGHVQIQLRLEVFEIALGVLAGGRVFDAEARRAYDAAVRATESHGLWEDARNARLLRLVFEKDHEGFLRLYFGTPYPGFRRRMLRMLEGKGYPATLPPYYDFALRAEGTPEVLIDSHTGRNDLSPRFLKPGQLVQRTLWVLSTDFFQPQRTLAIFERLFPGDNVDPVSSANRVQQSVLRLRRWLKKAGVPLELKEKKGVYWLASGDENGALRVRTYVGVPAGTEVTDPRIEEFLARLGEKFGADSFSSPQATAADGRPLRTVGRELNRAFEAGRLEKRGSGRATQYRIK